MQLYARIISDDNYFEIRIQTMSFKAFRKKNTYIYIYYTLVYIYINNCLSKTTSTHDTHDDNNNNDKMYLYKT